MKRAHFLICSTGCLVITMAMAFASLAQEQAGDEFVPLVINLLGDKDKDMRALGLEQIRTQAKGEAATRQFAAQLPQLPPDVQVGLLSALTDRRDAAARPAIVALLGASHDEPVRLAAIQALGFLGGPADLPLLLPLLSAGSAAEQAAVQISLTRMPGESIARLLASEMKQANPPLRVR